MLSVALSHVFSKYSVAKATKLGLADQKAETVLKSELGSSNMKTSFLSHTNRLVSGQGLMYLILQEGFPESSGAQSPCYNSQPTLGLCERPVFPSNDG